MSKGRGKRIVIKFDKALLGDVAGNQAAFTVTGLEKSPLFYGEPVLREYAVESVARPDVGVLYEDDFTGALDGAEVGENGVVLEGGGSQTAWVDIGSIIEANNANDRSYGWQFLVNSDIFVTALRIYPRYTAEHTVRLWDVATQQLVSHATGNAVAAQWNEFTLPVSVLLEEGKSYAVTFDHPTTEGTLYNVREAPSASEFAAEITSQGGKFSAGKNTFPTSDMSNNRHGGVCDFRFNYPFSETGTYTTAIPADTLPTDPRLKWTEDLPTGTSITAEYAVNQDALTPPAVWTAVSNAGLLTIPDPATGYFLWLRFTLSTEDTAVTPTLLSVWLEEAEAPPDTILLTMAETGRFNNVEGDLTVAYNQALGNLAGVRPVESFEVSFTPTDLEPTPVSEHTITVRGEPVVQLIPVSYHEYPDHTRHAVAVTAGPISVAFIHVDDVPP